MVVSHYVVSWIQIGGLIAGLYGFFFLSTGIFGKQSARWFRALLPATAVGIGVMLIASVAKTVSTLPEFIVLSVGGTVFCIAIYIAAARLPPPRRFDRFQKLLFTFGVLAPFILFGAFASDYVFGRMSFEDRIGITLAAGSFFAVSCFGVLLLSLHRLSESRLLRLGFVLSGLAILTQFIPPVLDLLGIAVK